MKTARSKSKSSLSGAEFKQFLGFALAKGWLVKVYKPNNGSKAKFYTDLQKALEQLRFPARCPHSLRHSFLTWFYDRVGEDMFLAEKVAGHRDIRDVQRYNCFPSTPPISTSLSYTNEAKTCFCSRPNV